MVGKMKFLQITMLDGSKYEVPANLIAEDRARYYGREDPEPDFETTYQKELAYTLEEDYELCDWAANNMNWAEVEPFSVRIADPPPPNLQEGWNNGEKKVISRPGELCKAKGPSGREPCVLPRGHESAHCNGELCSWLR